MSDRSAMPPAVSALAAGAIAVVALLAAPAQVRSADEFEVTIIIKDHKFDPAEIKVPAGKAVKLTVKNLDAAAEEFESKTLKVEKIIAGDGTGVIRLKPLAKGSHKFFGEYHEKTAQGVLIVEWDGHARGACHRVS
jgi:plastocyanin